MDDPFGDEDAIGFSGPEPALAEALGLAREEDTTIRGHTTSAPGVFVAGDVRMGARLTVTAELTVLEAAASGEPDASGEPSWTLTEKGRTLLGEGS